MNYPPSSPSGTSSASTSSSSSSSSDLVTPSPSPLLNSLSALDSLSLSPLVQQQERRPIHVVCNAPLVAPVPLPYHSPTFLQFDLPDIDADLSHPPYTKASPTTSPKSTKRKRSAHEPAESNDPLSPGLISSLSSLDSMLLLPPPQFSLGDSLYSYTSNAGGAPAAKRRRSFPAPFWRPQLHIGPTTASNSNSAMQRSTQQQQHNRALRHAISFSHSLSNKHHSQSNCPKRQPEIPVSLPCLLPATATASMLPFPTHSSQMHASTAPSSGFGYVHPYSHVPQISGRS